MPVSVIAGVVAGLACLGLAIFFHLRHIKEAKTKASWPSTEATVDTSGITHVRVSGENGGEFERFAINYHYAVAGATFHGYFYSDKDKNFAPLRAKYPPGTKFPVFYNPAKPAHSDVRDALGRMGGFPAIALALILYLMAAFAVLYVWRFAH